LFALAWREEKSSREAGQGGKKVYGREGGITGTNKKPNKTGGSILGIPGRLGKVTGRFGGGRKARFN